MKLLWGLYVDREKYPAKRVFAIISSNKVILRNNMQAQKVIDHIVGWLSDYLDNSKQNGFVVGVSGGIDSALTSTLCARTGASVTAISMPIYQAESLHSLSQRQLEWLTQNFDNVETATLELTPVFKSMEDTFPADIQDPLTMANTRARLRMTTLYTYAGNLKKLVAGTGNKVEDFGVGFYTKYGDGGVDLSPIADLMKSEVYALCKHLDVLQDIQDAAPTDGLWDDGRTDEGQIGVSYDALEWAMHFIAQNGDEDTLSDEQQHALATYRSFHNANQHKMLPIPVCGIPENLR